MSNSIPAADRRYTYRNYLGWSGPERYELIDGEAILMAGPSPTHQRISGRIHQQLMNFLEGKKCEAFAAPFDVRLFEDENDSLDEVDTVVQPDISVVCDRSRLDERGYRGSPEMVIEILSPASKRMDRLIKLNLYQRAKVKEYWIVSPEEKSVQVFSLVTNLLQPYEVYSATDIAKVNSLDGCFIELSKVFADD